MLYYPGNGNRLYAFTCAHVVDEAETVKISFLLPKTPALKDFDVCHLTAPAKQIFYSPLDKRTGGEGGLFQHTHDVAVIVFYKDKDLNLDRTSYCVAEAEDYMPLYAQGFPGGCPEGEELLFALDGMEGKVKTAAPRSPIFEFRIGDSFLDTGDRELELKGFSGSPMWDARDCDLSVVGLVASGKRSNAYRSLAQAVKMRCVQSMMKNHFGIVMETKFSWVPEEDVAAGGDLYYDGTLTPAEDSGTAQNAWLSEQQQRIRALIDDLKLNTAIELCRELMEDPRFLECSKEDKLLLMKHLMYCYDTCLMEQEAGSLEQYMRREGLIEEHDTGRWLTKLFMSQRYEELLHFAEEIPEYDKYYEEARFFEAMAKAFFQNSAPEETVGLYVDDQERLRKPPKDPEMEAFYLQIIGYVYDMFYHMPEKAIRCLNRSYSIGRQPIVCETLAGAYYHLAIRDALNENGRIMAARVDQENLYKARSWFLIIMKHEDELCFKGAIKRMGWEIFHTFAFLNDFYRILILYSLMKNEFPFKNDADRRDVERIAANVMIQGGSIDLTEFSALTEEDRLMFQTGAQVNAFTHALEAGNLPSTPEIRRKLFDMVMMAEDMAEQVSGDIALTFHQALIRMYSSGTRLFGWNVGNAMKWHYQRIQESGPQKLMEEMRNIIFETEHSYEENIQHFQEVYERAPSIQSWIGLINIHVRAGKLDKAEEMYQDLLDNHKELYQDAPEYAYRAYLDFIQAHQRDLKHALNYYLNGKKYFQDQDIAGFLEMEFRHYTSNFNKPEQYETERYPFVEKKLVPPEDYYRKGLIVYTKNLNAPKADEMFQKLPHMPFEAFTWEEIKYLVWRGKLEPVNDPDWLGMRPELVGGILEQYAGETWGSAAVRSKLVKRFQIDRICALDAWTLFLLAAQGRLDQLERLDTVYVPHSAVDHLLNEISRQTNPLAREALDYISACDKICIIPRIFPTNSK